MTVAGVWAVAATAIAVIALLDRDDSGEEDRAGDLATQISRVQRALDRRLDSIESQLEELPRSEDVSKLENRLGEAEDDASRAAQDAKSASESASDLEQRVEDLEEEEPGSAPGDQTP